MKKEQITVGGVYVARVSGRLVDVRVDGIREVPHRNGTWTNQNYDVTNLATGRKLTFRSAQKFRWPAKQAI